MLTFSRTDQMARSVAFHWFTASSFSYEEDALLSDAELLESFICSPAFNEMDCSSAYEAREMQRLGLPFKPEMLRRTDFKTYNKEQAALCLKNSPAPEWGKEFKAEFFSLLESYLPFYRTISEDSQFFITALSWYDKDNPALNKPASEIYDYYLLSIAVSSKNRTISATIWAHD